MSGMKLQEIEDVMYLIRMNLYWTDDEGFHDWREAEVQSLLNNDITLYQDGTYRTWDLHELTKRCRELCDEHFKVLDAYLDSKKEA